MPYTLLLGSYTINIFWHFIKYSIRGDNCKFVHKTSPQIELIVEDYDFKYFQTILDGQQEFTFDEHNHVMSEVHKFSFISSPIVFTNRTAENTIFRKAQSSNQI